MPDIKLLSPEDISKIAAGEVIERPASVLKELLENAVDAGARNIRVEIEGAGSKLLRVNDDGCGMSPANLRTACLRHATSKIGSFKDLDTLTTFGFRGEALFSVSAVSRLAITSCTHDPKAEGLRVELSGGTHAAETPAPPVPGTTVEVRDLFFNTPARLKFLKGAATERAHLLHAAEECALANPGVSFQVYAEGRKVYALAAVPGDAPGVLSRIAAVLGAQATEGFLCSAAPEYGLRVFASAPANLSARRDLQFFFVNRRPVTAKILSQALYKAYEGRRDKSRHPACVIYLETDPASFDVNVHPQKKEVRFRDEGAVFSSVYRVTGEAMLAATVEGTISSGTVVCENTTDKNYDAEKPSEPQIINTAPTDSSTPADNAAPRKTILPESAFNFSNSFAPQFFTQRSTPVSANEIVKSASGAPSEFKQEDTDPAWWTPPYRYLGQLDRSYLLFECAAGLMIMDQHAAQERILFEQYLNQLAESRLAVQRLMLAAQVELPASSVESLLRWKEWLAGAGFEIEQFGPKTILVHSVPSVFDMGDERLVAFVENAAELLGDPQKCAEDVRREMVAMAACKKAVKAHDRLDETEAMRLLRDLRRCKNGLNCPHGRPTMSVASVPEVAKRFRRTA